MKKLVLILACIAMSMSGIFAQNTCKMNVATFNLRLDTPSDSLNSWSHRKEMVKSLIRFHDFDIFGTQEGFKHQLDGILELGNYAYTGAGATTEKTPANIRPFSTKSTVSNCSIRAIFGIPKHPLFPRKVGMQLAATAFVRGENSVKRNRVANFIFSTPISITKAKWHDTIRLCFY